VIAIDTKRVAGAGRSFPNVAAETGQQQLHHVALTVVRRRRVGENEQFHFINCDLRYTICAPHEP